MLQNPRLFSLQSKQLISISVDLIFSLLFLNSSPTYIFGCKSVHFHYLYFSLHHLFFPSWWIEQGKVTNPIEHPVHLFTTTVGHKVKVKLKKLTRKTWFCTFKSLRKLLLRPSCPVVLYWCSSKRYCGEHGGGRDDHTQWSAVGFTLEQGKERKRLCSFCSSFFSWAIWLFSLPVTIH